jgi:two-component system, response regulator YesN
MHSVLIIDDEKIVRIAMKTIIKWGEYDFNIVGTAADGLEAISMIEKFKPDIIITDLKMPNMDGIQLIKWLKETNNKSKIIVLSNYDDFDFVKQALKLGATDYILKISLNAEMLIKLLQGLVHEISEEKESDEAYTKEKIEYNQNKAMLKNNFFRELFKEEKYDHKIMLSKAANLGIISEIENTFMYYLYIFDYDKLFQNLNGNEREALTTSIINTIGENIKNLQDVEFITMDDKRIAVIIPQNYIDHYDINSFELAEDICNTINTYLNIKVDIIISDNFNGLLGAKEMYHKCNNVEKIHFYGENIHVLSVNDFEFKAQTINLEYKKTLETMVILFEMDSTNEILNELDRIYFYAKQNYYHPTEFKKLILRIMDDLERAAYGNDVFDNSYSEGYKSEIMLSDTYDNCKDIVVKFCKETYDIFDKRKNRKFKREIVSIIEYLNIHFSEKLSLEMISTYVNMNGSYLCRMFKKETGESIFNYLNNIRIDKAIDILKNKDNTIKELAISVGMEDQFYFNRVFKKKTGVSPSEFRKKYFKHKE